ncbi:hypothetical protein NYR55_04635 [Sphingomonas sp. BGYR3]|uniref:hypothetical protein n=1 Tax=Sphingomonas sp. BGYR3 TaxID=2975483 RepID=UPI0021A26D54|nr:hypothetical protein [Sphingomonas sp. BGYR3]MDG5487904.1 hypothetical protein [Sphingomonas sp. BGYR3]
MSYVYLAAFALLFSGVPAAASAAGSRQTAEPSEQIIQFQSYMIGRRPVENKPEIRWSATPTASELAELYDPALPRNIGAYFKCRVAKSGVLKSCRVDEAAPSDAASLKYAKRLVRLFKLDPQVADWARRENAVVSLALSVQGAGAKQTGSVCITLLCVTH